MMMAMDDQPRAQRPRQVVQRTEAMRVRQGGFMAHQDIRPLPLQRPVVLRKDDVPTA